MLFSLRRAWLRGLDWSLQWLASHKPGQLLCGSRHPKLRQFYHSHSYFSPHRPLTCVATPCLKHTEMSLALLRDLNHYIEDDELLRFASAEFLAKVIAYRQLKEGMELHIPKKGDFYIDKVFLLRGCMPAFGIKAVQGSEAFLLFRGTDFSLSRPGRASILTDLDRCGPGCSDYLRHRFELRPWMRKHRPYAIGHSLGGALAMYAALFDADVIHSQLPSLAFNSPGLYADAAAFWKKEPAHAPLITYVTQGDVISSLGVLPGEVRLMRKNRTLYPIEAHNTLLFIDL